MQLVHAQQRRADAFHATLGHVHGHDRVGVDVVEVLVGQRLLQLLDAHHAAQITLGLALAFAEAFAWGGVGAVGVLGLALGQILSHALGMILGYTLGQILGSLIFVVAFEQCHGDQSLYLARM